MRGVEEALASEWDVEIMLVTLEFLSNSAHRQLIHQADQRGIATYQVRQQDIERISETVHAQGVVAVLQQKFYRKEILNTFGADAIVVALDGVAEPGNMGTIIRTCDWFGIDALLIGKDSVEIFNPKVVRSSMGSIFHMPIIHDVELISELDELKKKGYRVYATVAQKGKETERLQWQGKSAIVFGNEARGVSGDVMRLADEKIRIPRFGKAESLNVGIACGVVLATLRLRLFESTS